MSWIIGGVSFILLALVAGVIRYIGYRMAKKADNKYFGDK